MQLFFRVQQRRGEYMKGNLMMKSPLALCSFAAATLFLSADAALLKDRRTDPDAPQLHILAIGAHPDDIELNVGGTLLRYKEMGHRIYIALTTSGNTGSNVMTNTDEIGRVREAEMLASARIYDAKVRFLRNDDERLLDTNETRTQVLDVMRWADPDVIFTHWWADESPDHAMTSKLVRNMVLSLPGRNQQSHEKPCTKRVSVFMWEPTWGIGYEPEVYVDIGENHLEAKLAAIALHRSQLPYMADFGNNDFANNQRIRAAFRGNQYGCKYAETFRAFRIKGYMPDFKMLP